MKAMSAVYDGAQHDYVRSSRVAIVPFIRLVKVCILLYKNILKVDNEK